MGVGHTKNGKVVPLEQSSCGGNKPFNLDRNKIGFIMFILAFP